MPVNYCGWRGNKRRCESAIAHFRLLLTAAHHQPDLSKTKAMLKALQGGLHNGLNLRRCQTHLGRGIDAAVGAGVGVGVGTGAPAQG